MPGPEDTASGQMQNEFLADTNSSASNPMNDSLWGEGGNPNDSEMGKFFSVDENGQMTTNTENFPDGIDMGEMDTSSGINPVIVGGAALLGGGLAKANNHFAPSQSSLGSISRNLPASSSRFGNTMNKVTGGMSGNLSNRAAGAMRSSSGLGQIANNARIGSVSGMTNAHQGKVYQNLRNFSHNNRLKNTAGKGIGKGVLSRSGRMIGSIGARSVAAGIGARGAIMGAAALVPVVGWAVNAAILLGSLWLDPGLRKGIRALFSSAVLVSVDDPPSEPLKFLPLTHDGNRDEDIRRADADLVTSNDSAFAFNPYLVGPNKERPEPEIERLADFQPFAEKLDTVSSGMSTAVENLTSVYNTYSDAPYVQTSFEKMGDVINNLHMGVQAVLPTVADGAVGASMGAEQAYQGFREAIMQTRETIADSGGGLIPFKADTIDSSKFGDPEQKITNARSDVNSANSQIKSATQGWEIPQIDNTSQGISGVLAQLRQDRLEEEKKQKEQEQNPNPPNSPGVPLPLPGGPNRPSPRNPRERDRDGGRSPSTPSTPSTPGETDRDKMSADELMDKLKENNPSVTSPGGSGIRGGNGIDGLGGKNPLDDMGKQMGDAIFGQGGPLAALNPNNPSSPLNTNNPNGLSNQLKNLGNNTPGSNAKTGIKTPDTSSLTDKLSDKKNESSKVGSGKGGGVSGGSGSSTPGGEKIKSPITDDDKKKDIKPGEEDDKDNVENPDDIDTPEGPDIPEGGIDTSSVDPSAPEGEEGEVDPSDPAAAPEDEDGETSPNEPEERDEQSPEIKRDGETFDMKNPQNAKLAEGIFPEGDETPKSIRDAAEEAGFSVPEPGKELGTPVDPPNIQPGDVIIGNGSEGVFVGDGKVATSDGIRTLSDMAAFDGPDDGIYRLEGSGELPSGDGSSDAASAEGVDTSGGVDDADNPLRDRNIEDNNDDGPVGGGGGGGMPGGGNKGTGNTNTGDTTQAKDDSGDSTSTNNPISDMLDGGNDDGGSGGDNGESDNTADAGNTETGDSTDTQRLNSNDNSSPLSNIPTGD